MEGFLASWQMRQRQRESSTDKSGQQTSGRRMVKAATEEQYGAGEDGEAAGAAGLRATLLRVCTFDVMKELHKDFQYRQKWIKNTKNTLIISVC